MLCLDSKDAPFKAVSEYGSLVFDLTIICSFFEEKHKFVFIFIDVVNHTCEYISSLSLLPPSFQISHAFQLDTNQRHKWPGCCFCSSSPSSSSNPLPRFRTRSTRPRRRHARSPLGCLLEEALDHARELQSRRAIYRCSIRPSLAAIRQRGQRWLPLPWYEITHCFASTDAASSTSLAQFHHCQHFATFTRPACGLQSDQWPIWLARGSP